MLLSNLNLLGKQFTMHVNLTRTDYTNQDFQNLVVELDKELWERYQEKEAEYEKFNKTVGINNVVVLFLDDKPAGCGCFKKYDEETVEIKRMFVANAYRNKGLGGMIVHELESWALSLGYRYTVLETAIRQPEAIHLYKKLGYVEIEKYGPYVGMEESICMRKPISPLSQPSEFKDLEGIEYFDFEEDFIEENMRCIPMVVRFKMDAAGIKLKLAEWSRFNKEERIKLATSALKDPVELKQYHDYLSGLVQKYTKKEATTMDVHPNPAWAILDAIPEQLKDKAAEFGWTIEPKQWAALTDLQRFALLKLCRPGHENRNFPIAMKEFGFPEPAQN